MGVSRMRTALGASAVLLLVPGGLHSQDSDTSNVTFGMPTTRCTITDTVLTGLSGFTETPQGLMAIADNVPGVFLVGPDCNVTLDAAYPKGIGVVDVEDIGSTPDGTLWIADTGGNRKPRKTVGLLRWVTGETRPTMTTMVYPSATHDAEALLVDMRGVPTIVTKSPDGKSLVFRPETRMEPDSNGKLVKLGRLDVASWPLASTSIPGSLLITGGAVAPSGVHAALRTYTAMYEWDVPNGDVAAAIASRPPDRALKLPKQKQGESITYTTDGNAVLVGSEQAPSPVDEIPITRAAAPDAGMAKSWAGPAMWAAAAAGVLVAAVLNLLGRRGRTRQ